MVEKMCITFLVIFTKTKFSKINFPNLDKFQIVKYSKPKITPCSNLQLYQIYRIGLASKQKCCIGVD